VYERAPSAIAWCLYPSLNLTQTFTSLVAFPPRHHPEPGHGTSVEKNLFRFSRESVRTPPQIHFSPLGVNFCQSLSLAPVHRMATLPPRRDILCQPHMIFFPSGPFKRHSLGCPLPLKVTSSYQSRFLPVIKRSYPPSSLSLLHRSVPPVLPDSPFGCQALLQCVRRHIIFLSVALGNTCATKTVFIQ